MSSYLFYSHHQVICRNSPSLCEMNAWTVELQRGQLSTKEIDYY